MSPNKMVLIEKNCAGKRERQDSDITSSTTPDDDAFMKKKRQNSDVTSSTIFDELDVYCLAHIFSFLSWQDTFSIQQVSKKCKWAMDNTWCYFKVFESNKESVDLQGRRADDSHESYLLLHCSKYLRKYKKQVNFPITTKCFEVLRRNCRNLTYLEFSVNYQHKHYFFDAFTNMQKLKTIKIRLVEVEEDNNDDLTDTRILESVTRNVEEITLIGYEFKICLGKHFSRILEEFKSLTTLGIEQWTLDSSIIKVISQNTKLRHLSLAITKFDPDDLVLKDFTCLESFNIFSCVFATKVKKDHLLKNIITHLRHLKSLNIGLVCGDSEILLAITQFKQLTDLDINCHQMDQDILHKFKNLLKFNCADMNNVTDASVKEFIENNKDLELLNLGDTDITIETINYLYDWTKSRKHRGPVLRLQVNKKLFEETQDSLKLQGDNPYFIVEIEIYTHPVMIPEPKHLHVRKRSNSVGTDSSGSTYRMKVASSSLV